MQSLPNRKRRAAWKHVGKVALGKKSEKSAPQDLNYFILKEKNPRDAKYYPSERFHKIVGATPTELDIIIPYATADECLSDRRVKYGGNGVPFCKSKDGVRAMRWFKIPNTDNVELKEIECPGCDCPYQKDKTCKDKAVFEFMIPGIDIGTFHLDTGSEIGIENIINSLETIERICTEQERQNGIWGVRCKLVREATAVAPQGRRTVKYILNLHIDYRALMQADKALLGPILGQQTEQPMQISAATERESDPVQAQDAEVGE